MMSVILKKNGSMKRRKKVSSLPLYRRTMESIEYTRHILLKIKKT